MHVFRSGRTINEQWYLFSVSVSSLRCPLTLSAINQLGSKDKVEHVSPTSPLERRLVAHRTRPHWQSHAATAASDSSTRIDQIQSHGTVRTCCLLTDSRFVYKSIKILPFACSILPNTDGTRSSTFTDDKRPQPAFNSAQVLYVPQDRSTATTTTPKWISYPTCSRASRSTPTKSQGARRKEWQRSEIHQPRLVVDPKLGRVREKREESQGGRGVGLGL